MKKFLVLGLVLVLVLTMAVGCSSDKAKYEDGTYTAETEFDSNGYKGTIEIVVSGGKITSVDYDELNEAGDKKSEDAEYAEMMEGVSGITPAKAYDQLEKALISKQNADDVDLVSGATTSAETFKALVKEALNQ